MREIICLLVQVKIKRSTWKLIKKRERDDLCGLVPRSQLVYRLVIGIGIYVLNLHFYVDLHIQRKGIMLEEKFTSSMWCEISH